MLISMVLNWSYLLYTGSISTSTSTQKYTLYGSHEWWMCLITVSYRPEMEEEVNPTTHQVSR